MYEFEKLNENIYRLWVPFENLCTSVFLITTDGGDMLIDCATVESDIIDIIVPALKRINAKINVLALTHLHGDHAGAARFAANAFEEAQICAFSPRIADIFKERETRILQDGDTLLGCVKVLHLPGHSHDSVGYFDTRTNTLIGGDAVQLYGIGKYGTGLGSPMAYKKSVEHLLTLPIKTYVASHEFVPLGAVAESENVEKYFKEALNILKNICAYVNANASLGEKEIADAFNVKYKNLFPNMPLLPAGTVKAILAEK